MLLYTLSPLIMAAVLGIAYFLIAFTKKDVVLGLKGGKRWVTRTFLRFKRLSGNPKELKQAVVGVFSGWTQLVLGNGKASTANDDTEGGVDVLEGLPAEIEKLGVPSELVDVFGNGTDLTELRETFVKIDVKGTAGIDQKELGSGLERSGVSKVFASKVSKEVFQGRGRLKIATFSELAKKERRTRSSAACFTQLVRKVVQSRATKTSVHSFSDLSTNLTKQFSSRPSDRRLLKKMSSKRFESHLLPKRSPLSKSLSRKTKSSRFGTAGTDEEDEEKEAEAKNAKAQEFLDDLRGAFDKISGGGDHATINKKSLQQAFLDYGLASQYDEEEFVEFVLSNNEVDSSEAALFESTGFVLSDGDITFSMFLNRVADALAFQTLRLLLSKAKRKLLMSRDDEGDGVSAVAAAAAEPHQSSHDADTVVAHSRIEHGQRVQLERCVTSLSIFPSLISRPNNNCYKQ
jgi:hypothetical protein